MQEPNCEKNGEEFFKKLLDPDADAEDFQNVISSSLSTCTTLVKLSWRSDE